MSVAAQRPRRPNPLLLAVALTFALVTGLIVLGVVAVAVALLGTDWIQLPGSRGGRVADPWWLLATAGECVLLAAPLAWFARGGARMVSPGWDTRKWPLVALVAALLAVLLHAPLGWWLLAAAALFVIAVWWLALTPRPAPRWRPRGTEVWLVPIGAALLALATTTYAALHPVDATFEDRTDDDWSLMWKARTPPRTFELTLENESDQAVTLRSLRVPNLASGTQVRVHGGLVHGSYSDTRVDPLRPLAGVALADEPLLVELRLTRATCAEHPAASYRFARVEARFETLGLTRTQRFAVDPPGRLRCPGRQ